MLVVLKICMKRVKNVHILNISKVLIHLEVSEKSSIFIKCIIFHVKYSLGNKKIKFINRCYFTLQLLQYR